ncbi:MAG: flippase-like domain-containing protein [Alphaproteobacteria bacterium]|nr:flippase-like domain-containing protein [Alphaproteobacteria bacterium]
MIKAAIFFGLVGLLIATGVIAWSGYDQVLEALEKAGLGIIWTSLFHIVPMIACVLGWQALMPAHARASKAFFLYVLWIRASINNLMPVARIGGEIVSVRLMMKYGIHKSPAIASTVVEITTSIMAQFVFVLLGILLFATHVTNQNLMAKLMWGLVISAPAIALMFWVQRVGFFSLFDKLFHILFREKWARFAGGAARLDKAVRVMYRRRDKAIYCFVMQFFSWALCSVEIWLALKFLGHPMSLAECMMIEALIQATGSAAFIVPGALGVQEAGFLLFGSMLGLTPEIAAALAVIRRCRDLILYVPGLIFWQFQEGRWLLERTPQ